MSDLFTQWAVDPNDVLSEYPRPQMTRKSYLNLNGFWSYAITKTDTEPAEYDGSILVPFSPECLLSRVQRTVTAEDFLWYKRQFTIGRAFDVGRIILHFGAVDQMCRVYVNGRLVGDHVGGYLPFCFDVTEFLNGKQNELVVMVKDETEKSALARGKQKTRRGTIWYTPQSGIWQTVWIESVPKQYITDLKITPLFDESAVNVRVVTNEEVEGVRVGVLRDGELLSAGVVKDGEVTLELEDFTPWTPENPFLYDLVAVAGEDRVGSYFGMRKWSVGRDIDNVPRMMLNNEPFFFNGLLDQGYWSDGMYTAPSDDALIYDIVTAKDLGFNTLRKHIKIEPLRWYYHCDRLGMIVWQDIVNGGEYYKTGFVTIRPMLFGMGDGSRSRKKLARVNPIGRQAFIDDLKGTVSLLYNTVSLALYTPFNEGWGQFDSKAASDLLRKLDPTRMIDHASGWYDQGANDLNSKHVYFRPVRVTADRRHNRPLALTEFGGYSWTVGGHAFSDQAYGYKKFDNSQELTQAYTKLYCSQIIPAIPKGLCACIYTQLTDVEDEHNGLMTYDRRILKMDENTVATINARLKYKA